MAPPGLTALGAKGSACDRLCLTGRLRAPPRVVMKYRCAGEVGALSGAFFMPPLAAKIIYAVSDL